VVIPWQLYHRLTPRGKKAGASTNASPRPAAGERFAHRDREEEKKEGGKISPVMSRSAISPSTPISSPNAGKGKKKGKKGGGNGRKPRPKAPPKPIPYSPFTSCYYGTQCHLGRRGGGGKKGEKRMKEQMLNRAPTCPE